MKQINFPELTSEVSETSEVFAFHEDRHDLAN